MRNLTIKREKSFVSRLKKAKVYIKDELAGDTKINGDKCYKLGDLKNGEEKTFVIGDEETTIYVIQDKFSKNMCNEICIIPAGVENIYLMGECKFNPLGGDNFRFHGMTDPRVLANRKKGAKKFGAFLALCAVVGFVCGFIANYDPPSYAKDGEPKAFVHESGVKIVLTDIFEETEIDGTVFTYGTDDAVVFGYEESFTALEGMEDWTEKEYAEELSAAWGLTDAEVQEQDGLVYFEYSNRSDDTDTMYSYMVVIYKTGKSFWNISFAVDEAQYKEYKPIFVEWAKSVEFAEE